MYWATGLAVYFVVWWIVLFAVLPFGVHREENPQRGNEPGAPARPLLLIKVIATTLVSFVVWLGIYFAVSMGLVDFRAG